MSHFQYQSLTAFIFYTMSKKYLTRENFRFLFIYEDNVSILRPVVLR
jgi:hypothetical protein